MRRFYLFALLGAVLSAGRPASAAVGLHTYTITGGTSSGTLNIGTITGGTLKVNFPVTLCNNCSPGAYLASAMFTGTAGMLVQSSISPLVPGYASHPAPNGSIFAHWITGTPGSGATFEVNGEHSQVFGFWQRGTLAYVITYFSGFSFFQNPGHLSFTAEVAVPEPSASALLATGAVMLGAYALRRARRSLG